MNRCAVLATGACDTAGTAAVTLPSTLPAGAVIAVVAWGLAGVGLAGVDGGNPTYAAFPTVAGHVVFAPPLIPSPGLRILAGPDAPYQVLLLECS